MPNFNYRAGRRVEYERRKFWKRQGYEVVRSSGSHGIWDLAAVHLEHSNYPVELIQIKRVQTIQQARNMIQRFRKDPPLKPSNHYHIVLEVQVKGNKEILSTTM